MMSEYECDSVVDAVGTVSAIALSRNKADRIDFADQLAE